MGVADYLFDLCNICIICKLACKDNKEHGMLYVGKFIKKASVYLRQLHSADQRSLRSRTVTEQIY